MSTRIDHMLGVGHGMTFFYLPGEDQPAGIFEWHRCHDGDWAPGYVAFRRPDRTVADLPTWEVVKLRPLTLTPSIACRSCGNHGWIRNGRWEDA